MSNPPTSVRVERAEGDRRSTRDTSGAAHGVSTSLDTNGVRGKLTPDAPLAPLVWFKSGGSAEWLFEPKDLADLQDFLRSLDPETPLMALGLGSNLIVRDGGVYLTDDEATALLRDAGCVDVGRLDHGRPVPLSLFGGKKP